MNAIKHSSIRLKSHPTSVQCLELNLFRKIQTIQSTKLIDYHTCTGPAAFNGPPTPPPMIWPSELDKHTLRPPVFPPMSVCT